jgi:phosphoserine phosphatase
MRIILARHGETEWNRIGRFQGRSDIPLNEKGKTQVKALATALREEPLTAIYTSPLIRAVETAESVRACHPGIALKQAPDLIEMDLGAYEGMYVKDWADRYPDVRRDWQRTPSSVQMPDGENLKAVQNRAVASLERIAGHHSSPSTLLICSHNFVIISILCHVRRMSLDRFREIKQDTAAYSIIEKQGDLYTVERLNVRSHS